MTRSQLAAFVLIAALVSFAHAAPEAPATTKPATQRTVLKISVTPAGYKEPISCLVDFNDAPDLKDWAIKAGNYALKWYPELDKRLASDNFTAPRTFTLFFKDGDGVAATSGRTIRINARFVRQHPDDMGMVAHELVHVIQGYKRGYGWITEAIADYLRYYVVEPGAKNARFNPERSDYKNGYQPAAAMLNFLERRKPGSVQKLNAACRDGSYKSEVFKEIAGEDADTLWQQFKGSLKK